MLLALAVLLAMASAQVPPAYNFSRVLVAFAHPDDAETICGGLVAQLVAQGAHVEYLVATNGDHGWNKGFNMTAEELARIRKGEQLAAAAALGVANVTFLDYEDGSMEAQDPMAVKYDIVRTIRLVQPDLVLTFSPEIDFSAFVLGVEHRDHATTGERTFDSVYPAARDYLAFESLFKEGVMPWRVPQIWTFAFQGVTQGPDPTGNAGVLVNVTGPWLQAKYEALLKHESQYSNATAVYEELLNLGSVVSQRNGQDPAWQYEAYRVVQML